MPCYCGDSECPSCGLAQGTLIVPKRESGKRDKLSVDDPKAIFKAMAMDIGKEVVAYVDVMYPNAAKACSSTFRLSLRNVIYNEIMAAMEVNEEGAIIRRLKDRAEFRRKWRAQYKKIRKEKS